MLSAKCGGISICLFSLSFFFPNTFKALSYKSTVRLLRVPAVLSLPGTIHSVCGSAALRCTLMERAEAPFIIIIKHHFAVTCRFSSSQLKGALITRAARWEGGSCCCPRFADEESGGLAHPARCPRARGNSPSESAARPETPTPARGFIPGNNLCSSLRQSSPSGLLRSSAFL